MPYSRRGFLGLGALIAFRLKAEATERGTGPAEASGSAIPASFPAQDPEIVREIVGASHGNLTRVKELVSARPALARASWDWGYGDWESAIDAASHVGNRPIAEYLIANGARPTFLTAVMMGQLALVRGWIESTPGIQTRRGPHGITAAAHARAGGAGAADVLKYLESLGDADPKYPDMPLTDDEPRAIAGEYSFGPSPTERLTIAKGPRAFTIQRPGFSERNLTHLGGLVFVPAGAEAVRVRFELPNMVVQDGPVLVRAQRL